MNMNRTSQTPRKLPRVTAFAAAYIRASRDYTGLLRVTAKVYGHSNREIIGRVQANLPLDTLR